MLVSINCLTGRYIYIYICRSDIHMCPCMAVCDAVHVFVCWCVLDSRIENEEDREAGYLEAGGSKIMICLLYPLPSRCLMKL